MSDARSRTVIWLMAATAGVIYVTLHTAAQTPRGRLNVIQVVAALFFIGGAIRSRAPTAEVERKPDSSQPRFIELAPALIVGTLAWIPMLPFYFISEDFEHLMSSRQPMLSSLVDLTIHGQLGTFLRPFGFLTIFIDYRLWGLWPVGYHLTNLAIHLTTAVALYYFCKYAGKTGQMAGCAALIYAVLAVQAEAVAWMGARFDLLSACLTAWAAAFYMKFRRDHLWSAYAASAACLVFAILSKENAFVLPLLLLAAEVLLISQRRFAPLLFLTALTAALFVYRWFILGGIGGYADPTDFGIKTLEGLPIRAPALTLLGYYWFEPEGFAFSLIVAATTALLLTVAWHSRSGPDGRATLAFGFAWAVLSGAPTHGLLFINASMANSRILHLGSLGIALFVAVLLASLSTARTRRLATGGLAVFLALGCFHNLAAWEWTSRRTRQVLEELKQLEPEPKAETQFVFHDLPEAIRGVYFLRAGLADSIRITYGRDDLSGERVEKLVRAERPVIHMGWQGETSPSIRRAVP